MSAFQITPFGIVVIAVFSFAIWIVALVLSRLLASLRWRWWLLAPPALFLMALPWAEEAWIAWHFREACKSAGVNVYRRVEVEGFYDATGGGINRPGPVTNREAVAAYEKDGYLFRERLIGYDPKGEPLQVSRVERIAGSWQVRIVDQPTARYHYRHSYQPSPHRYEEPVGWKLQKSETEVVDIETREVLGRDTGFHRYPNIAEALWLQFFGPGGVGCSGPLDQPEKEKRMGQLYRYVLIPSKSN